MAVALFSGIFNSCKCSNRKYVHVYIYTVAYWQEQFITFINCFKIVWILLTCVAMEFLNACTCTRTFLWRGYYRIGPSVSREIINDFSFIYTVLLFTPDMVPDLVNIVSLASVLSQYLLQQCYKRRTVHVECREKKEC